MYCHKSCEIHKPHRKRLPYMYRTRRRGLLLSIENRRKCGVLGLVVGSFHPGKTQPIRVPKKRYPVRVGISPRRLVFQKVKTFNRSRALRPASVCVCVFDVGRGFAIFAVGQGSVSENINGSLAAVNRSFVVVCR